ncbi:MAG: WG repeat-containing protein [Bacteroidota bacterium]
MLIYAIRLANAQTEIKSEWFFVDENGKKINSVPYDDIQGPNKSGLYMVGLRVKKSEYGAITSGKFGVSDAKGKLILPCEYDEIDWSNYSDYYKLKKDDRYGIIDAKGNFIAKPNYLEIEINDKYWIGKNSSGYCGATDFTGKVILENKYSKIKNIWNADALIVETELGYGVYGLNGKQIIPVEYDYLESFNSNNKHYFTASKGFSDFIFDKSGKVVLDKYSHLTRISEYDYNSSEEKTPVFTFSKSGKIGVVDLNGKEILPANYDNLENITVGNSSYFIGTQKKMKSIVDRSGKVIVNAKYNFIETYPFGNYLIVSNVGKMEDNYEGEKVFSPTEFQLLDLKGKPALPFSFKSYTQDYGTNFLILNKGDKYGIINDQLKTVINFEYNYLSKLTAISGESYFSANKGGKINDSYGYVSSPTDGVWGLINSNNQTIIPFEYEEIKYDSESEKLGLIVKKSGKYGWYKMETNEISIAPKYDEIDCRSDYCIIKYYNDRIQKDVFGVIDNTTGKTIIEPKYSSIVNVEGDNNLFIVENNEKYGVIALSGEVVVPITHNHLKSFQKKYLITNQKGQVTYGSVSGGDFGLIDLKGKVIVKNDYKSINKVGGWYNSVDTLIQLENHSGKKTIFNLKNNTTVVDGDFDNIDFETNTGLYIVKKEDHFGLVNNKNKVIIPINFSKLDVKNDFVLAVDSSMHKSSLFDVKGNSLLSNYNQISFLNDSIYMVSKESTYNIYNARAKRTVFNKEYESLTSFNGNNQDEYYGSSNQGVSMLIFEEDGKKGVLNLSGKIVVKPIYNEIQSFNPSGSMWDKYFLASIQKSSSEPSAKWGIAGLNGNNLLSFEFDNIRFEQEFMVCIKNGKELYYDYTGVEVKK